MELLGLFFLGVVAYLIFLVIHSVSSAGINKAKNYLQDKSEKSEQSIDSAQDNNNSNYE